MMEAFFLLETLATCGVPIDFSFKNEYENRNLSADQLSHFKIIQSLDHCSLIVDILKEKFTKNIVTAAVPLRSYQYTEIS